MSVDLAHVRLERRFDDHVGELAELALALVADGGDAYRQARLLVEAAPRHGDDPLLVVEAVRYRLVGALDVDPADRLVLAAVGLVAIALVEAVPRRERRTATRPADRGPRVDAEAATEPAPVELDRAGWLSVRG